MAIVHRRIFYAKVGMAGPLVAHMQEGNQVLGKYATMPTSRIMTDDMTGRSDRVVVEWDVESVSQMNSEIGKVMATPEGQREMGQWMEKLATLIEYAEGENWIVQ